MTATAILYLCGIEYNVVIVIWKQSKSYTTGVDSSIWARLQLLPL